MVKFQRVDRDGSGIPDEEYNAAETTSVGHVMGVPASGQIPVYNAGTTPFGVCTGKADGSWDGSSTLAANDPIKIAKVGDDKDVWVKTSTSGAQAAGKKAIACQDPAGYATESSTADDVALYGIGTFLTSITNGEALVRLSNK